MLLGVFDSGLGGLMICKAIEEHLPDIDILYYGDTLHVPYGSRSPQAIETYTRNAMDYMFEQGCSLIVMACNTASALCLRRLQQEYLPTRWPGRNIIGVVVPTLEEMVERGYRNPAMIATKAIVHSHIYEEELKKIDSNIQLCALETPLLVPLLENGGDRWLDDVLKEYVSALDLNKIDSLILGCTHYVAIKQKVRNLLGDRIPILSQDEIIPAKLKNYLKAHPEYSDPITRGGRVQYQVSDLSSHYEQAAQKLYGRQIDIKAVST